jgi:hypothetical protein
MQKRLLRKERIGSISSRVGCMGLSFGYGPALDTPTQSRLSDPTPETRKLLEKKMAHSAQEKKCKSAPSDKILKFLL